MLTYGSVSPDLAASVAELRSRARRQGYTVADGHTVEDWRPDTERDARHGDRGKVVEVDRYSRLGFSD
jgi:hypothetical protein